MTLHKLINSLLKTNGFSKADKFVNKTWKGVIAENIKVFPLVCSKYLCSWTRLGRSGHVQSQSFGSISHVSGPKLNFWGIFIMVLDGFVWRSSKKQGFETHNLKDRIKKPKIGPTIENYRFSVFFRWFSIGN